jgi:hypothetical protein
LATIAWGDKNGWAASRVTGGLPEPHVTSDVAVADLDADGWNDIIILGGGNKPNTYVYWGGENGMGTFRRSEIVLPADSRAYGADLDGEGHADLAIASSGKLSVMWAKPGVRDLAAMETTSVEVTGLSPRTLVATPVLSKDRPDIVIASGADGVIVLPAAGARKWAEPLLIPISATHVAVGDVDGDGHADLITTDFSQTRAAGVEAGAATTAGQSLDILWGNGTDFATNRATQLPAPFATSSAVADIDGDGHADLAVAIYQGATHFEGTSLLYWGKGDRKLARAENGFTTQAPIDVAVIAPTSVPPMATLPVARLPRADYADRMSLASRPRLSVPRWRRSSANGTLRAPGRCGSFPGRGRLRGHHRRSG